MPRRRCPVCRSKEWHKEAGTGLMTCSEGHVLQNYRNETSERTEFTQHAMRKRTVKVQGRQQRNDEKADDEVYHGRRARYLYFECLQLLLRMQVNVLVQEWHLPEEFEIICRDLWALHLSLLPRPPEAEPYLHAQGRGGDADTPDLPGTPSESEPEDAAGDLLKEASEGGTSDEEEANADCIRRDKRIRNKYEVPAGNIAVLVVACWTMRVPVMYKDLIRLIDDYKLPYLEAMRVLPIEMKRRLARGTRRMLSPQFPPTVKGLHRLASRLARLCRTRFGIHTPEMNAAPLLWRLVGAMKGEATLYDLTKKMAHGLSLSLLLGGESQHKGDSVPVEMALMGALVVVLKLVYGLDGRRRDAMMERGWEEYVSELETEAEEVFLESRPGRDILEMGDDELDGYLRFCKRALLDGEEQDKTVAEFFPLSEGSPSSSAHPSHVSVDAARCLGTEKISAGIIRIYDAHDVLGTLPPAFQLVLGRAARFCAVHPEHLAALVQRYEHRLCK